MKGRSIRIRDEAHWKELRAAHTGGSDISAMLGLSTTKTPYQLWQEKKNGIVAKNLDDDERVYWGKLLEPVIAKGVADRTGWTVKNVRRYISGRPDNFLGATLDREVYCPDRGWGVLELKVVDRFEFKKWDPEEGTSVPYQLQLQLYLGLTGKSWGAVAALVGGNNLQIFEYDFRPTLFELMVEESEKFWASVEADTPPEPDFDRDGKLLALLHRDYTVGKAIDLTGDPHAIELADTYISSQRTVREAEKAQERAKAELFHKLGDAESAQAGKFEITSSFVAAKPAWHIGLGDIGRMMIGRSAYRKIHVKERL